MSDEESSFSSPGAVITPQKSSTPWSGSLRMAPVLIATILAASITVLALALTSALQVYSAPLDESLYSYPSDHRWSVGWYIAYFTVAPFVSTIYALLDFVLYFLARLSPYYAGLGSTVLAIGWIMQLAFWLQCDFVADYNQCQQFYLVRQTQALLSGAVEGVSTEVTHARVALGFLLVALYVVYLILAVNAAHKKRSTRESQPDPTAEATVSSLQRGPNTNARISAAVFYA